jgi:twitching motility protein PilT
MPQSVGERLEFVYDAPAGQVEVQVVQQEGTLQLQIGPAAAGGPARAAAATTPATATAAPAAASPPVTASGDASSRMDLLFRKMFDEKCSDLHLSSGHPPLFRKDGEITELGDGRVKPADEVRGLLRAIAPERNWKEFEERHDTDFAYELKGVARYRCNLFMDRIGPGGVFRLIPSEIPTAEQLGLSQHILGLCHLTKGLVVVTGPTGSGKSTTLAAMIDYINKNRAEHILTIEDPVEFVHPVAKCLINQREVGVHTDGFKSALRAALREDPDIVLVGEMRDLETVAIALETAETGHLVFGTLHTNTAPSTIDRIIDQFPADEQSQIRTMLSEALKGVIAQTLCRKVGGGRVAAHELLFVTPAIGNMIREAKTFQIPSVMQTGKSIGMRTLNESLLELVQKKLVEPEEAYAKSVAKSDLAAAFERNEIKLKSASADKKATPAAEKQSPGTAARKAA